MHKHFFFGAIFFLSLSFSICAQTTNRTTNQTTTSTTNQTDANEENSDIVITATVQAKELKMEIVPTPKVEFPGTRERQTVWEADRQNLPAQVQPGVVYRDIGIRLRIYSRFSEIQRIVLEAIDQTNPPADDQAKPANNAPPTNNQTTNPTTNPTNETVKPPVQ